MAKMTTRSHRVDVKLQAFELTKAGTALKINIYEKDKKIGELQIGRGSLTWWARNAKKPTSMTWSEFAKVMVK
ncbi:MAG: hypothetical protein KA352_05930 [Flavobacteriales bacterium]|nr:hypothetical protein [Flavobacteriales bacterium]